MSARASRTRSRNAATTIAVAALCGCCAGAAAAVASAGLAPRTSYPITTVGPVQTTGVDGPPGSAPQPVGTSFRPSPGAAPTPPAAMTPADSVILRARTLAREPDVGALVDLREAFLQDARRRGAGRTGDTKRQLAEIDRALNDARLLRLKLDGEQLRRMRAKRP